MRRLAQVLVTSILKSFGPSRSALVMSTRYGAVQATPQLTPFTYMVARLATSPTSSQVRLPLPALHN